MSAHGVSEIIHDVESKIEQGIEKVEHVFNDLTHRVTQATTEKVVKAVHLGADPDLPITMSDWSGFVGFTPSIIFQPTSIEQLTAFLNQNISGASGKIRALGGLHSCSKIAVGDIVINVASLPKTVVWSDDLSNVTVSANWNFHDFLLQLSAKGRSIQATGGTDQQTLAVS